MVLYVMSHRNKTDSYFMNKHGNPLVTCLTIGKNNQKLLAYQHNWNWFCNKVEMEENTADTYQKLQAYHKWKLLLLNLVLLQRIPVLQS